MVAMNSSAEANIDLPLASGGWAMRRLPWLSTPSVEKPRRLAAG